MRQFSTGAPIEEIRALLKAWYVCAREGQLPPDEDWRTWIMLGGRGAGKTRAGAEWVREQVRSRRAGRIALAGPSLHEVREVMIEGHSGLRNLPGARPSYEVTRRRLLWPNGAEAHVVSALDPDNFRGPQFDAAWADELCVWPHVEETLSTLRLGLRLGDDPRLVVTTTPRPIPALKRLLQEPGSVSWRVTTESNKANLAPGFFESVAAQWGASAYGRQELEGELLEDQQGALWTRDMIERCIVSSWPEPDQIVIAVDPPASLGEKAEAAASAALKVAPGDHPLAPLLASPNPEQTGAELFEAFFGHLQVAGNAFLEAASLEGDPPRQLYVLRPDRMAVIPGARGWPLGWEYRVGGQVTRFERDPFTDQAPILHLKLFAPADDWYGQSPMEAAAFAIDIHNAGGAWNKALIDNAARPSGALVYSGAGGMDRLTADQFARLKGELEDAHAGAANAGRPLLLEGGLDWKPMSLSPTDMDFIEARHAAAREIALAFGVPPMLLGIPGDNTYANYREANLAFWRQTALPLALKTARALEAWLGARWPDAGEAKISVDLETIPALAAEREALWARLEGASFVTDEEKRAIAGLHS